MQLSFSTEAQITTYLVIFTLFFSWFPCFSHLLFNLWIKIVLWSWAGLLIVQSQDRPHKKAYKYISSLLSGTVSAAFPAKKAKKKSSRKCHQNKYLFAKQLTLLHSHFLQQIRKLSEEEDLFSDSSKDTSLTCPRARFALSVFIPSTPGTESR